MSTVYLAEDLKLPGKTWAVKQYKRFGAEYAIPQEEVSVLLQLNHPYLPHIVDYFPPDVSGAADRVGSDSGYLVMEFIDGVTLEEWLEPYKLGLQPPLDKTLEMGLQILELLQYLHSFSPAPIIFRDLKPSNLMLDKQGKLRLIDFGIARIYKPGQAADTVPLGTVAFAAPEQLNRLQTDQRSDLYSLGALMYYLLSGGRYYTSTQKPIHRYREGLHALVSETIHRMLESDPEDRFQTASEARNLLQQAYNTISTDPASNGAITSTQPSTRHKSSSVMHRILSSIFVPFSRTNLSAEQSNSRKIIVIGALYAGAGATFTTISLACAFGKMRIPVLAIEAAVKEPELAALIQFPPHSLLPTDPIHSYYDDELISEQDMIATNRKLGFVKDSIRWLALNPSPFKRHAGGSSATLPFDHNRLSEILKRTTESIVLLDVGDSWKDDGVQRICKEADDILVVIDPFPSKWDNDRTRSKLESLTILTEEGCSVSWIMNKDAVHARRKERMASVPSKPVCVLPYISAEQRLRALDQGKLVQDIPSVRDKLAGALNPFLKQTFANSWKIK